MLELSKHQRHALFEAMIGAIGEMQSPEFQSDAVHALAEAVCLCPSFELSTIFAASDAFGDIVFDQVGECAQAEVDFDEVAFAFASEQVASLVLRLNGFAPVSESRWNNAGTDARFEQVKIGPKDLKRSLSEWASSA